MEVCGDKKRENRYHLKKVYRKFGKAIQDYQLIDEEDHILVGLSGGKDSLALLELLQERNRISGNKYVVIAAHISVREVPYLIDDSYLKNFCDKLGVEFIQKEISMESMQKAKKEKSVCFTCSWIRRKTLFELAKEKQCNKIALGHHQNDAVETLLMNMTFQGSVSSMPPKLEVFKGKFTIIRPLILSSEEELLKYAEVKSFKKLKQNCPYEHDSQRGKMRMVLQELEKMNPFARQNIYKSMSNIQEEYLPEK